jgi:CubicO group peptidase (beta-lactamase class C family)
MTLGHSAPATRRWLAARVAVVEAKRHHGEAATRPRPATLGQVARHLSGLARKRLPSPHPPAALTPRTVPAKPFVRRENRRPARPREAPLRRHCGETRLRSCLGEFVP